MEEGIGKTPFFLSRLQIAAFERKNPPVQKTGGFSRE